jgi:hypothetical protein
MSDSRPRFEFITDRDNLPSVIDHELNREAPFFGVESAKETASELNEAPDRIDQWEWRKAEAVSE